MKEDILLKNCPICGSDEVKVQEDDGLYSAVCYNCNLRSAYFEKIGNLIKYWNNRKIDNLVRNFIDSLPSCTCDEYYFRNGLVDPNCIRCNWFDETLIHEIRKLL